MTPWTLTRKDNNATLELPADMRWRDEFDWQALAQSQVQYSLGGSAIIQQGTMLAGRPVTLGGEWIWLDRATLTTLAAWADVPELEMTLAHPDGRQLNVCFARPALSDLTPVAYRAPEDGTAQYEAPTLHLMTI
ncbi:hypothetical protein [Cardiobacterium hominis]|uniref:hypothetical protein n=1 Tax=Cardiobacterium hominis TaxID=2718 RepID=UPI00288A8FC1|nr:hypothetical protein [Cardiobacterium hominis]